MSYQLQKLDFKDRQAERPSRGHAVMPIALAAGLLCCVLATVIYSQSDNETIIASTASAATDHEVTANNITSTPIQQDLNRFNTEIAVAALDTTLEDKATKPSAPDSAPLDTAIPNEAPKTPADNSHWISIVINKGDTLSTIFERAGIGATTATNIARTKEGKVLRKIRPGQTMHMHIDDEQQLLGLNFKISRLETLTIHKTENGYHAQTNVREPNIKVHSATAQIRSSLSHAASNVGISQQQLQKVIDIFGWKVDFARDIRKGDQFSIIYETLYLDGHKVRDGDIIAAQLKVGNKDLTALRYKDADGNVSYYTPDGLSLKNSFLRSPIENARITSGFTLNRFHPVLKKWRAHKGIDYGAATGTPIRVTGDGVVKFVGRKGGYGKVVIVSHRGQYKTLYAHMSRFGKGIKVGKHVTQGQTIGYVGSTGMSTGPHLHYEFQVKGVHVDPLKVELPSANPIAKKHKPEFIAQSKIWMRELAKLTNSSQNTQIAASDTAADTSGKL